MGAGTPRLHHSELQTSRDASQMCRSSCCFVSQRTLQNGCGWMGGRLQKLTEFSERGAKTLSWQKLQKDITADVVDWWFGVSVGHEKRRRGVSG